MQCASCLLRQRGWESVDYGNEFTWFSSTVPTDIEEPLPLLMRFQIVLALLTVERVLTYRTLAGFVSDNNLELSVAGTEKRVLLATTSSP